jgi:hypothetical protein
MNTAKTDRCYLCHTPLQDEETHLCDSCVRREAEERATEEDAYACYLRLRAALPRALPPGRFVVRDGRFFRVKIDDAEKEAP